MPAGSNETTHARAGLSRASVEAYAKDMRIFREGGGQFPTSVDALKQYLFKHRTLSPSTLHRRCQAIRHTHQSQGLPSPTADPSMVPVMRALHRGIVLDKKILEGAEPEAGARRKTPTSAAAISRALLTRCIEILPRNMAERRDIALLLLLFHGALRRTEAVALNIEDLKFTSDALLVKLGERQIAIARTGGELCAARACLELIQRAAWDIEGATGPLFRRAERGGALSEDRLDPGAVSLIIKRMVAATGTDPKRYSGESPRLGRMAEAMRGRQA
jgi:integrase